MSYIIEMEFYWLLRIGVHIANAIIAQDIVQLIGAY